MQALLEAMDSQVLGNTIKDNLISVAVFLIVLVALPIGKANHPAASESPLAADGERL